MQIRDDRLYRATHGTFEDYCRAKWGIDRRYANRLIGSIEVMNNLTPRGVIQPEFEKVLRPLTPLPPEKQREVWKEAVETAPDGKVTAKHVQERGGENKGA